MNYISHSCTAHPSYTMAAIRLLTSSFKKIIIKKKNGSAYHYEVQFPIDETLKAGPMKNVPFQSRKRLDNAEHTNTCIIHT